MGSLRSYYQIKSREGDERLDEWKTRGDVARERFVAYLLREDKFTPEDCILLLDADQRHPVDMLEVLRDSMEANNLDMVCAHYYRRETKPIQSLCYEVGDGQFPFLPFLDPPKSGLHEIALTGFGCVLIKKKVLQAVAATLPTGMSPIAIAPLPEIAGDHGNWGPDYRFFYLARKAGFKLWLNADVESLHGVTLWLGHKSAEKLIDYHSWANAAQDVLMDRLELHGVSLEAFKQRLKILDARKRGFLEEVSVLQHDERTEAETQRFMELSVALYEMDGRIKEVNAWIEWQGKYPPVENGSQLPTTKNTAEQSILTDETLHQRQAAYQENAVDLVKELPYVAKS